VILTSLLLIRISNLVDGNPPVLGSFHWILIILPELIVVGADGCNGIGILGLKLSSQLSLEIWK
jgi:hypothetical protein